MTEGLDVYKRQAGDSAGAFAVPALTGEILESFYPECEDVTLLSDSGQLLYDKWQRTAKKVWKTKEEFWRPIKGANITLEWYRCQMCIRDSVCTDGRLFLRAEAFGADRSDIGHAGSGRPQDTGEGRKISGRLCPGGYNYF